MLLKNIVSEVMEIIGVFQILINKISNPASKTKLFPE